MMTNPLSLRVTQKQIENIPEIRPFSATYLRRVIFIMRFIAVPILLLSSPLTAFETFVVVKDFGGVDVPIIAVLAFGIVMMVLSGTLLAVSTVLMAWTLTLEEQHQRLL